jgi:hypothetical protein
MRLKRLTLACGFVLLAAAPTLRAEYVVLRSGQRLNVTGYELVGGKYLLQMTGGKVEIPAGEVVSIEPEEVFTPLPAMVDSKAPYRALIRAAAERYNVDADLITTVIAVESNFKPMSISRKNARGLMQLLPQTAARLGVQNIFDPQENINAGTQYLRELLQRYNDDLALALAAYNAGPERVDRYGHRVPPYLETISYVRQITRNYAKCRSTASPNVASTEHTSWRHAAPQNGGL